MTAGILSAVLAAYSSGVILAFKSTYADETDDTVYTNTAADIGNAGARHVIVGVMSRVSAGTGIIPTSVTVGGVSATLVASGITASERNTASLWIAAVPTGATGDIVATFAATVQRMGMAWWSAYGLSSATPTDTATSNVSGAALDVDVSAGGIAIGYVGDGSTSTITWTWTGVTEEFDEAIGSGNGWHSGGSYTATTAQTPLAITSTASGSPGGDQYVTASFR